MVPVASAGFAAIAWGKSYGLPASTAALMSGAVRLLLAVVGSAIIIWFTAVPVLWFLVWLGLFYIAALVAEVYFAILMINRQKEQRL
jgi:purine-cytosine permease-like protein